MLFINKKTPKFYLRHIVKKFFHAPLILRNDVCSKYAKRERERERDRQTDREKTRQSIIDRKVEKLIYPDH